MEDGDKIEEERAEQVFFAPARRKLSRGERIASFGAGMVLFWGLIFWWKGAPPGCHPAAVETPYAALAVGQRSVRVAGSAHYVAKGAQHAAGSDEVWYLYPLFPPDDLAGREVHVMVRTRRAPPEGYQYGEVVVEGAVIDGDRFLTDGMIATQVINGYFQADEVLVIDAFDDD